MQLRDVFPKRNSGPFFLRIEWSNSDSNSRLTQLGFKSTSLETIKNEFDTIRANHRFFDGSEQWI